MVLPSPSIADGMTSPVSDDEGDSNVPEGFWNPPDHQVQAPPVVPHPATDPRGIKEALKVNEDINSIMAVFEDDKWSASKLTSCGLWVWCLAVLAAAPLDDAEKVAALMSWGKEAANRRQNSWSLLCGSPGQGPSKVMWSEVLSVAFWSRLPKELRVNHTIFEPGSTSHWGCN